MAQINKALFWVRLWSAEFDRRIEAESRIEDLERQLLDMTNTAVNLTGALEMAELELGSPTLRGYIDKYGVTVTPKGEQNG